MTLTLSRFGGVGVSSQYISCFVVVGHAPGAKTA